LYISLVKYICLTEGFSVFTKGKIYKEYKQSRSNILYLINDLGEESTPSISGYNGPGNFVVYFCELVEWRQKQIDKILWKKNTKKF